jgi:hypothetical protein
MNNKFFLLPILAVVFALPRSAKAQQDPETERKISIEITTTENGQTTTKSIDLENATDEELQQALRDLGIMEHFSINGEDENVIIDIRRFGAGEDGQNTNRLRTLPPMPPMPPRPEVPGLMPKHTWLGVSNKKLSEETIKAQRLPVKEGVEVIEVIEGSPAKTAGLLTGDVITALDGKAVTDPGALSNMVREYKPGDKVKITYYRDGKKKNASVTLGEREAPGYAYAYGPDRPDHMRRWRDGDGPRPWQEHRSEPRAFLGVTPGERAEGVSGAVISAVEEGSAAEKMGLEEGDIIRSLNGEAVGSFRELSRKIRDMKPGDQMTLTIERNGAEQEVTGELGERKSTFRWSGPDMDSFNFNMDSLRINIEGLPDGERFKFEFEGLNETEREKIREDIDKLRREMQKLREDLSRDLRSETRIIIESRKLTDEEKALLKDQGVTGLDNELDLGDLRTFPNPSDGFFRIHFDVEERGDLHVDVHDATGERVYQEKITGFKGRYERTLDLSDKASGNYFIVITQNGKATSRKLVKQ